MKGILTTMVALVAIIIVGGGIYYASNAKIDKVKTDADKKITEIEKKLNKADEDKAKAEAEAKKVDTTDWKAYKNNTVGFTVSLPKDLVVEETNSNLVTVRTTKLTAKAENVVLAISDNTKNSSVTGLGFADMAKKMALDAYTVTIPGGSQKCDSVKATDFKTEGGLNALEMSLSCSKTATTGEKTNFTVSSVYALDVAKFAKGGAKTLLLAPPLPDSKVWDTITPEMFKAMADSVVFK